jgi:hypothetical protein
MYSEESKTYHQQYWINNRDKFLEKNRDNAKVYYQNNKDKINEKYTCECGSYVSRHHYKRHESTKKHIAFINP